MMSFMPKEVLYNQAKPTTLCALDRYSVISQNLQHYLLNTSFLYSDQIYIIISCVLI